MEASRLNSAKNSASPPLHLHSHLFHVAKHEENPLVVRSRPTNIISRPYFHSLLHSRPLLPFTSSPSSNLSQDPKRHITVNLLFSHLCSPPCPNQFPSCHPFQDGYFRGCNSNGLDSISSSCFLPSYTSPACIKSRGYLRAWIASGDGRLCSPWRFRPASPSALNGGGMSS